MGKSKSRPRKTDRGAAVGGAGHGVDREGRAAALELEGDRLARLALLDRRTQVGGAVDRGAVDAHDLVPCLEQRRRRRVLGDGGDRDPLRDRFAEGLERCSDRLLLGVDHLGGALFFDLLARHAGRVELLLLEDLAVGVDRTPQQLPHVDAVAGAAQVADGGEVERALRGIGLGALHGDEPGTAEGVEGVDDRPGLAHDVGQADHREHRGGRDGEEEAHEDGRAARQPVRVVGGYVGTSGRPGRGAGRRSVTPELVGLAAVTRSRRRTAGASRSGRWT